MRYYTGVGSRETLASKCRIMRLAAKTLALEGWTLRSGHADRADWAFERGAIAGGGGRQIFVPWWGFNGASRKDETMILPQGELLTQAMEVASVLHPKWSSLKRSERMLHARNVFQVMGPDLDTPSACLVCWTEDGQDVGGTRTAILVARSARIPVLNLGRKSRLFGECPYKMTAEDVVEWVTKHATEL